MNDSLRKNGYHQQKQHYPMKNVKEPEKLKESFESIPFLTACLTYSGFYVLMLLGFLNQLLFKPKVAKEQNREVKCIILFSIALTMYQLFAVVKLKFGSLILNFFILYDFNRDMHRFMIALNNFICDMCIVAFVIVLIGQFVVYLEQK